MSSAAVAPAGHGHVSELLGLLKVADTVELKVTVPESDQRSAVRALALDPLQAEIRQAFFFDTPDLALDRSGVVLRARRMQRKGGDAIVKLRPVAPESLPPELRRAPGFGVEVDAMPGGFVCSATMKRMTTAARVQEVVEGARPLRKLFAKEQRAFVAGIAGDVDFGELSMLGPIFVLKLRFKPPELGRRLVAEVWLFPDDSRVLELSTKCATDEAFEVAAETRAFLEDRGLDLDGEQAAKTRRALALLAKSA